ncbi:CPBP family intramembrane glutamic endopeptidase [Nakamurella aerolata]|uniref:CPBP family intramembrane metalloprotease n=1 Tax=Nakamurella aerolata TaxID=1656892 RepID=A0A849AJL6_9ACTN|nr:CPBP family intramembrane glutamic endopeptidase [Nakamurella aerolata]NNG37012.1 CPBP family intramembrane metalloprotease [Nakamurella aerolata]
MTTARIITDPTERRAVWFEIVLVFTITLGMSGLRSLISLLDDLLAPTPLKDQTATIVVPQARASTLDLLAQLLSVVSGIAWGTLGLYLLWRAGVNLRQRIGAVPSWRDVLPGLGLAALIGIPGLGLYLLAQSVGANLTVAPTALNDTWWRVPVLILQAFENGFLEEFLVLGYLITRLSQLGLRWPAIVAISAVLRGSYHLYQGFGGFVGNVAMGIVFAIAFLRWHRVWPMIIAHTTINIVAFVGYPLLHGRVSWLP